MDSFIWGKNYETGIFKVDTQHQQLVSLLNRFGESLSENQVTDPEVESLLNELVEYSLFHFREEEELMAAVGLDERHVQLHQQAHQDFVVEVGNMLAMQSGENGTGARYLHDFLTHWLTYHILGMDQNMARQYERIQDGMAASQAFEMEERTSDSAMETLLTSLSSLFEQVSQRNRELSELNRSLEDKVAERTRELFEANRNLEIISLTDVLTELPNRRYAMQQLDAYWRESSLNGTPLVCIMIDADHFKAINDTWGHDAGDLVLKTLSSELHNGFRTDDLVCRLGGDEFFTICPNTDLAGGLCIAEKVRAAVAAMLVKTGDGAWKGSVSMGVAARTDDMTSFEALIKLADQGVYMAKSAGKNCVRSAA